MSIFLLIIRIAQHLHIVSVKETCQHTGINTRVLFSLEKISDFSTVALSFLFDKYCPIIN